MSCIRKFRQPSAIRWAAATIVILTVTANLPATDDANGGADNDRDEAKRARFKKHLRAIDPAFTGGPFQEWKREYDAALRNRDQWEKLVSAAGDSDTRTSRAGEVIAFSGDYKVESVPVADFQFPIKSKGGGLRIFVFRPVEFRQDGQWVVLPEKIRSRRYLLVRGRIPDKHDPYSIVACTYLANLTEQQVVALVNESREF